MTPSDARGYPTDVTMRRSTPWAVLPLTGLLLGVVCGTLGSSSRPAQADFAPDEQKFNNAAYPPEFRKRVQDAIVRGANWLLLHQAEDGSWAAERRTGYPLGPTALATLALLKAGIPPCHPRLEKAFEYLRKQPLTKTYEVSILLMAIDARYDPVSDPFAKEEVDRYGQRVVPDPCATQISKEDLAWMRQGVDFLVKHQVGGYWRYPEGGFDLSNTQYALLGLKAADRCGLRVPLEVWRSSLAFLLGFQEADGPDVDVRANEVRGDYRIEWSEKAKARGFTYTTGGRVIGGAPFKTSATGSMTTAGAAGLMICQSMLWKSRKFGAEERARTRVAVRDALAWMQLQFDVTKNPNMGMTWHYYYLYGLERMGILGHFRFIGKKDWYEEGAEFLRDDPNDPGSWMQADPIDTSFALLFLKRSSFRTVNPVITPGDPEAARGDAAPTAPAAPGDAGGK